MQNFMMSSKMPCYFYLSLWKPLKLHINFGLMGFCNPRPKFREMAQASCCTLHSNDLPMVSEVGSKSEVMQPLPWGAKNNNYRVVGQKSEKKISERGNRATFAI